MAKRIEFTVNQPGIRIDIHTAENCGISRAYARKLIDEDRITVNGQPVKASHKPDILDNVLAIIPPPAPIDLAPEDIPLNVVYENSDLIVVDKPAGLVVHPAAGQRTGTLVNALLAHCPDLGGIDGSLRPGIVHRLDKDTSGLMVVAKNDTAQASLSHQIQQRSMDKKYIAFVVGHLSPEHGAIEAPIGRDPRNRKRMAVVEGGKEARTQYNVIKYLNDHTLLEAILETGRTHQIRVHFSAIGFPIFGDPVYGKRSTLLARQFLHAYKLGFILPSTGDYVEFTSDLPRELNDVLEHLIEESSG